MAGATSELNGESFSAFLGVSGGNTPCKYRNRRIFSCFFLTTA
jgi:hypothetical protein